MCGIAGIYDRRRALSDDQIVAEAKIMSEPLRSRGPDAHGEVFDKSNGLALMHRRLSIRDLTESGAQPMKSESGRFVLTFNGEIYNYLELKKAIEKKGIHLRGTSDTEVLLETISEFGLDQALKRSAGMFAFALFDNEKQKLFLARDRFGEKPLFYGNINGTVYFASELKSFLKLKKFNEIDGNALQSYLRYSVVASSSSILKHIQKVEPGTCLEFSKVADEMKSHRYWSLQDYLSQARNHDDHEVVEHTRELLNQSLKDQMTAESPLGTFLSGGIDSSLITAFMSKIKTGEPLKTFSVGFENKEFDESRYAEEIAQYLKTEHHTFTLKDTDALPIVTKLGSIYDEPFADSSQVATYFLSKNAANHIKVCLTGDAGDEVFSGYNRYRFAPGIWKSIHYIPSLFKSLFKGVGNFALTLQSQESIRFKKISKVLDIMSATNEYEIYNKLLSQGGDASTLLVNEKSNQSPSNAISKNLFDSLNLDFAEKMQYCDTVGYLNWDILQKTDRASMACGLETRAPFLDHRIVQYAWSLRQDQRIRSGQTKWVLRQLLNKELPAKLFERPKSGFAVPVGEWMRSSLKEWAQDILFSKQTLLYDADYGERIQKLWNLHQTKKYDHTYALWTVLMFRTWEDQWLK